MSNTYEQKPNTGSLFRNEKKESDKHPDYNGSALIDGTEYWISAWLNESQSGKKYFKFSFKPKDEQAAPKKDASFIPASEDDDSQVPF